MYMYVYVPPPTPPGWGRETDASGGDCEKDMGGAFIQDRKGCGGSLNEIHEISPTF